MKRVTSEDVQHLFMTCNKCGSKHRRLKRLEQHLKGCKK